MMLNFDPEKHEYTIADGVKVPSVTEVLPEQKFWCTPEQLEAAREEGEDNHSLIKMFFDTGDTFREKILEDLADKLKELKPITGNLVSHDNPMFSARHFYAGTPDAIFENAIVDFKRSRGDYKRHALQLAGYHLLARENKIIKRTKIWLILYYTGKEWKELRAHDERAEDVFLDLVKRWHINESIKNYFKE
jgi:hypothetical protein